MKLYNSLTRKKEEFTPIKPKKIGMYVCGPTVYDEPHIGHARSAYIFDVIRRYLVYRDYKVTFVRNVTDVDDKIIEKAKKVTRSPGHQVTNLKEEAASVAKRYLDAYHEDMELLGIGKPDKEPKATEYILKMTKFIEKLVERGAAYVSGQDVYFDIKKAKDYGKLSNQNLDKMEVGARIAPGEKKRDPLDFALWKSTKEGEPSWPSPWGEGRPGWHIECSVMSSDILGEEFDIHGGGIDLIFPHHENEIAQSEGAGGKFARYWIHNGLLTINSEKMAKSLGNFITIKDFLEKYKDADYLKLFFLSAHYRSPIDFTDEKIEEAKKQKERILNFLKDNKTILGRFKELYHKQPLYNKSNYPDNRLDELKLWEQHFEAAMNDDFNMPQAIADIFNIIHYANTFHIDGNDEERDSTSYVRHDYAQHIVRRYLKNIFGINVEFKTLEIIISEGIKIQDYAGLSVEEMQLLDERNKLRKKREFKKADEFRNKLIDQGIIIEDTHDGIVCRRKH